MDFLDMDKMSYRDADRLFASSDAGKLLASIDELVGSEDGFGDPVSFYLRGRLRWKLGQRGGAISDYERSVALDPESPAAEALAQAREVMSFYFRDLYNP